MALIDPFVLADGVVLLPVRDLPEQVRRGLPAGDEDFAISRPNARITSKVVDSGAAELLRQFANPTTIGEAVARYSRRIGQNAEELLMEALPLLQSLMAAGLLVPPDSKQTRKITPSIAGWEVVRPVQTLEDTDVFLVRSGAGEWGALKVGLAAKREAGILAAIQGNAIPKFLEAGEWKGQPWLLMEWYAGVDAQTACEESGRALCPSRVALAGRILESYTALHEQGVVHGDVHPRNILVDRAGGVRLIDFGYGRRTGGDVPERAGVGFFLEPELARALARGGAAPAANPAAEQYAVAALVYLLLTGSHYLDFSLERNEMLRQIAEDPALPLAEPWPEMEAVLGRALSKDPVLRFPSMRALGDAFVAAARSIPRQETPFKPTADPLRAVRNRLMAKIGFGGPLLGGGPLPPPMASLNYGSAGVAYGLYRMACAGDDGELLALADAWSARAVREIADDAAFYNRDLDVTPETVGRRSLFHTAAGIHAVEALIAQARGDAAAHGLAVGAFLRAADGPEDEPGLDVTLGRAGVVLACDSLLGCLPYDGKANGEIGQELREMGRKRLRQIWRRLDGFAPIAESRELSVLGIAHGWAGLLYATLRWCAALGDPPPSGLAERLDQLATCAEPAGRGLQWKWDLAHSAGQPGGETAPGWCNGSAGYVYLWTQADRAMKEPRYLALAEGAAWNAWETRHSIGNLCCGMAGQAYSLLNLYRHTGEAVWLVRARELLRMASPAEDDRPESLYKGVLGLLVLEGDLERPEQARMPMFEAEV